MRRFAVFFACLVPLAAAVPQKGDKAAAAAAEPAYVCPEEDGNYEDPEQCDIYWECKNGKAIERLCDDGLVYDPRRAFHSDPCDSSFLVDCGTRTKLQPETQTSIFCPRRNGHFPDPDTTICDVYYTCTRGVHTMNTCPTGLQYDLSSGTCAWPDVAARTGCGAKAKPSVNGFICPSEPVLDPNGNKVINPTYADADDCRVFYVCLNGVTPQLASCDLGKVFNENTGLCDQIDKVPECRDTYRNNPLFDVLYDDADGDGLRDFGDRTDFSQTSIN